MEVHCTSPPTPTTTLYVEVNTRTGKEVFVQTRLCLGACCRKMYTAQPARNLCTLPIGACCGTRAHCRPRTARRFADYARRVCRYATFCEAAGVDPTDAAAAAANLPPVDSNSVLSLFGLSNSSAAGRQEIHLSNESLLLADGWKLVLGNQIQTGSWLLVTRLFVMLPTLRWV